MGLNDDYIGGETAKRTLKLNGHPLVGVVEGINLPLTTCENKLKLTMSLTDYLIIQ